MRYLLTSPHALGSAIRNARRAHGLTQVQLADRAGLSQPMVSDLERGASAVSFDYLLRLASALDLELVLQTKSEGRVSPPWQEA